MQISRHRQDCKKTVKNNRSSNPEEGFCAQTMSATANGLSLPWSWLRGWANKRTASGDTNPGAKEPIQWMVVAEMPGLVPANIVAERLRLYGLPVRVWQESVGQAFGLAFGPMGTGFVAVPAEHAAEAAAILASPVDSVEEEDDTESNT
jgi:hypothetical protein